MRFNWLEAGYLEEHILQLKQWPESVFRTVRLWNIYIILASLSCRMFVSVEIASFQIKACTNHINNLPAFVSSNHPTIQIPSLE